MKNKKDMQERIERIGRIRDLNHMLDNALKHAISIKEDLKKLKEVKIEYYDFMIEQYGEKISKLVSVLEIKI